MIQTVQFRTDLKYVNNLIIRCVSQIETILKSPAVKRPGFVVNSLADAEQAAEDVLHGRYFK